MGIKSLFFGGKSSSSSSSSSSLPPTTGSNQLKGYSYDSAVALDPPLKGTYPVAGNGPNALEEIQRSRPRAKKDGRQSITIPAYMLPTSPSPSAATPPNVPRYREETHERPRTAPHNGRSGGGYKASANDDRTRSGFSMKSPPSFFGSGRRGSTRSTYSNAGPAPPVPITALPNAPKGRDIKTYQPKKGMDEADLSSQFQFPFASPHQRNDSVSSKKTHVDLFEAHTNIRPSQEASRHRAKASGIRDYGEDVADRNILQHGARDKGLEYMDSPEFSYLKAVYSSSPKNRFNKHQGEGESSHSRTSSALGHVLGHGPSGSDDIQPLRASTSTSTSTAAKPHPSIPSSSTNPSFASRNRNDDRLGPSTGHDGARAPSLWLTAPIASPHEDASSLRDPLPKVPTPPVPLRGRARTVLQNSHPVTAPSGKASIQPQNPPPNQLTTSRTSTSIESRDYTRSTTATPSAIASPRVRSELRKGPPVSFSSAPPEIISPAKYPPPLLKDRNRRTMSSTSQDSYTNGHTYKNGPVSYSPYPNTGRGNRDGSLDATPRSVANGSTKRQDMIVEGAKESPNLKGIVDLSNTVDTDVTTKPLPAVVHEHVVPTQHEIIKEVFTKEYHNHHFYHRILPVVETIILPTLNYVHGADGKLVNIPESDVPKYTGKPLEAVSRGWKLVRTDPLPDMEPLSLENQRSIARKPVRSSTTEELASSLPVGYASHIHMGNSADGPLSDQAQVISQPRTTISHTATEILTEPILVSKKTSMTKEGYPRTEYVWRHPPVFEDCEGRTQPMRAPLRDLIFADSVPTAYNEFDLKNAQYDGVVSDEENDLLFRDSGYGSGMLPGLSGKASAAATKEATISDVTATTHQPNANKFSKSQALPINADEKDNNEKATLAEVSRTMSSEFIKRDFTDKLVDERHVDAKNYDEKIKLGRVVGDEKRPESPSRSGFRAIAGEATNYLQRMKERRRSSATRSIGRTSIEKGKGRTSIDVGDEKKILQRSSMNIQR